IGRRQPVGRERCGDRDADDAVLSPAARRRLHAVGCASRRAALHGPRTTVEGALLLVGVRTAGRVGAALVASRKSEVARCPKPESREQPPVCSCRLQLTTATAHPTARSASVSTVCVTDADLVTRARQGDPAAFGELVDRHRVAVYRAALAALGSHAEAEDAA